MDNFTQYVFSWCPDLLTNEERQAHRHLLGIKKLEYSDSDSMRKMLKAKVLSTDENVLKLLSGGEVQFYKTVKARLIADKSTERFMNRCPSCRELARTPEAKQCWKCYFSWHDKADSRG